MMPKDDAVSIDTRGEAGTGRATAPPALAAGISVGSRKPTQTSWKSAAPCRALAFGGAFNPPTRAHIELAHFAMEAVGAECVIFIPSKRSYVLGEQGKDFSFTDEERLAMLTRVAAARPWMRVSSYEISLSAQPRTYHTLCHLREEGYAPRLLFGADKLTELETVWRHVDEICREFGIVCLSRGEDDLGETLRRDPFLAAHCAGITLVEAPQEYRDISSSRVRRLITAQRRDPENEAVRRELEALLCEELYGMADDNRGSLSFK